MSAPTKAEYYGENYANFSDEEKLEFFAQESREATGLLLEAAHHIETSNPEAARILHTLRDELIQDEIDNGKDSDAVHFRTLFHYRRNTVGIQPVYLPNGNLLSDGKPVKRNK